ncbi:unnamed protein product [Ixodes persulcatus]
MQQRSTCLASWTSRTKHCSTTENKKKTRKIRKFCLVFECIMKQVLCMQHRHRYTSESITSITQR